MDERFDPTREFSFRLTVPYRVDDRRSYATFVTDFRLPDAFGRPVDYHESRGKAKSVVVFYRSAVW